MANFVLLVSACTFGSLHLWMIYYYQLDVLLTTIYSVGVITSILNHGLTSTILKWSDRGWMTIGTLVDCLYLSTLPNKQIGYFFVATNISHFLLAKGVIFLTRVQSLGNVPHLITHLGTTLLHLHMCNQIKKLKKA